MNYPVLVKEQYYGEGEFEFWESVLYTCTDCSIEESFTDFKASLTLTKDETNDLYTIPQLWDVIRIKHADGAEYEFKVNSVKYDNGTYSISANYRAYDFDALYTGKRNGMYTPKSLIDTIFDSDNYVGGKLDYDYQIRSTVTCDDDTFVIPYKVDTPVSLRSVLYNGIVGRTFFSVKPNNTRDLELVKQRGSNVPKILAYGVNIVGFSFEQSETDLPIGVAAYYKGEFGDVSIAASEYGRNGSYSIVDVSSQAASYPDDNELISLANYEYYHQNPYGKKKTVTFNVSLSSKTEPIQIGDIVYIDYDPCGVTIADFISNDENQGEYTGYRVSSLKYNALEGYVTQITVGDTAKDISDIIASQNTEQDSSNRFFVQSGTINTDEWENNEHVLSGFPYTATNYLVYLTDEGDRAGNGFALVRYGIRIKKITSNAITLSCDDAPDEQVQYGLYFETRGE